MSFCPDFWRSIFIVGLGSLECRISPNVSVTKHLRLVWRSRSSSAVSLRSHLKSVFLVKENYTRRSGKTGIGNPLRGKIRQKQTDQISTKKKPGDFRFKKRVNAVPKMMWNAVFCFCFCFFTFKSSLVILQWRSRWLRIRFNIQSA